MFHVAEYLLKHPPVLWTVVLFFLVALILWIAAPVTWRDGEGDARDDSEAIHSWLRWLSRW